MDELVRWLGVQLDEDERIARAASPGPWEQTGVGDMGWTVSGAWAEVPDSEQGRADADFIAAHDPARVLREIDAKRQLLARYERAMENRRAHPDDLASAGALLALHGAVKLLALPYANRPGFKESWRP